MEQKRITLLMVRGKSKLEFANKLQDGWTGGIKNERDSAISYIKSSSIFYNKFKLNIYLQNINYKIFLL